MPDKTLEFCVYDPSGDTLLRAVDVLPTPPRGISYDDCALWLHTPSGPKLGDDWSMGRISVVGEQLAAAGARLRRGQPALVRSAVFDEHHVPYVLFEPEGERAAVSVFLVDDPSIGRAFPIPGQGGWGGATPDDLYDWVAAHRVDLYAFGLGKRVLRADDLRWDVSLTGLIDDLDVAATQAAELAARLRWI